MDSITVPFKLTHVRYVEGDVLGYALAVVSLLPIAALISIVTLIAFRRDIRTVSLLGGLLANEILNAVLKYVIREPRPVGSDRADHGMPSSHSQFAGFFTIYIVLAILLRFEIGRRWSGKFLLIGVVVAAFGVCFSRVYLGYHTQPQVVVGFLAGAALALVWFFVFEWVAFTYVWPTFQHSAIAKFFRLRDYFTVGDLVDWEYTNARAALLAKTKKE